MNPLTRSELFTLVEMCQAIAAHRETKELELLSLLEPSHKRQLWAALPRRTKLILQTLATEQGAAA